MVTTLLLGTALLVGPSAPVHPNPVLPGRQIEVVATCAAGIASATISAAALDGASDIPMLKSAASPTDWVVTLTIPAEARPGIYDLAGKCGNGNGFTARVVVATTIGPAGGGGSTSTGPNLTLLWLGIGLVSVALILLRRSTP